MTYDHITFDADTDYFFLGDGRLMVALQWSRNPLMSPFGLVLCDPDRMSRKEASLLFHPEFGLSRTMLTVTVDGVRYQPQHHDLVVRRETERGGSVAICWHADDIEVIERFTLQVDTSNLLRHVTLTTPRPRSASIELALYANPIFFDAFATASGEMLRAVGYNEITVYSVPPGRPFERFLTVDLERVSHKGVPSATFVYSLGAIGTHDVLFYPLGFTFPPLPPPGSAEATSEVSSVAQTPGLAGRITSLFESSLLSMRAAISKLGRFDASIWQYDYEWGMDASIAATAATTAGAFDLARQILTNILQRLSNAEGMIAEAGRFRGGAMSELNGNGAVLDALWHYWKWSGDVTLLEVGWPRIAAIAEYPLRKEFEHESGLLRTRRDFWERTPWMGVDEGFELAHQVYCSVGLRRAAEMARSFGYPNDAERWHKAAERIIDAMLSHPTHSLVENGRFIHRRRLDGSPQMDMVPTATTDDPRYIPYLPLFPPENTRPRLCEPDITEALPIVYGLIDPCSPIARATLEHLEDLWSPNGAGGYARYNPDSDPDSPGAWPFATAFVAAAQIEAGLNERSQRAIEWLIERAGPGGCWFEYYGERSAEHAPVGIIVWAWAEYLLLVTKHILGVRVRDNQIRITPRLVGLDQTLRFGSHRVRVLTRGLARATLDGMPITLENGTAVLKLPPGGDRILEFLPEDDS